MCIAEKRRKVQDKLGRRQSCQHKGLGGRLLAIFFYYWCCYLKVLCANVQQADTKRNARNLPTRTRVSCTIKSKRWVAERSDIIKRRIWWREKQCLVYCIVSSYKCNYVQFSLRCQYPGSIYSILVAQTCTAMPLRED